MDKAEHPDDSYALEKFPSSSSGSDAGHGAAGGEESRGLKPAARDANMESDPARGETAAKEASHPPISEDLFCPECAYNLRTLTGNRCPECGSSLESLRSTASGIPWTRRDQLGWFRAYWKTVRLATFGQRRFVNEIARPVDFADSQRFRWLTILHVYLPILMMTGVVYPMAWYAYFHGKPANVVVEDYPVAWALAAGWPVAAAHVLFLLFVAGATGAPSYFFHPRGLPVHLQNRAVAMSYYASGALALTFIPATAVVAAVIAGIDTRLGLGLLLFAVLVPLGQAAAWWLDLMHLARRIMPQRFQWASAVGLYVPLLWALLAGLIFFAIPFGVFLVLIVARSLA